MRFLSVKRNLRRRCCVVKLWMRHGYRRSAMRVLTRFPTMDVCDPLTVLSIAAVGVVVHFMCLNAYLSTVRLPQVVI